VTSPLHTGELKGGMGNQRDGLSWGGFSRWLDPPEGEPVAALQVRPLKGKQVDIAALTQMINALAGTVQPLYLEIAGTGSSRMLVVRCPARQRMLVSSQLTALYGSPEITDLGSDDDPVEVCYRPGLLRGERRMYLGRSEGLPLRTWQELADNDPLIPLLGAMADLHEGEACLSRLILWGRANPAWADRYKRELLLHRRRNPGMPDMRKVLALITLLFCGLCLLIYYLAAEWLALAWMPLSALTACILVLRFTGRSDLSWSEALEESVTRKVSQQAYRVELCLLAAAGNASRVDELLDGLAGAYRLFGSEAGNMLEPCKTRHSQSLSWDRQGSRPGYRLSMNLGDEEIAALWHLPVDTIPDMLVASRVSDTLPDPASIAQSPDSWLIGKMGRHGRSIAVHVPRTAITSSHTLIMGKTQMGKSTLLNRIICEASQDGRSILVIDPHDDLIMGLLESLPANRAGDVIYLNFADPDYLPGLNILDVRMFGGDAERTKEAFLDVAKALFKRFWGPRMEVNFDKVVMTLALANTIRAPEDQLTILHAIPLIAMQDNYQRNRFLDGVLPHEHPMTDSLLQYWREEFANLTSVMMEAVVMPVLSKLRQFESNSNVMSIFGQPRSTFDIMHAVSSGKIILVRTGATLLSEEYSDFIGSFILNLVRRALFSRFERSSAEHCRVTIVVDESQSFTGIDYASFLAQVAKFGGNLILTTQGAHFIGRALASDQVSDPYAWSTLMANIDTLVVFRIDGEDARLLSTTEFFEEKDQSSLIYSRKYSAFVRFSRGREVLGPFLVEIAPPMPGDPAVRQEILRGRGRYCLPRPAAVASALASMQAGKALISGQSVYGRVAGTNDRQGLSDLMDRALNERSESGLGSGSVLDTLLGLQIPGDEDDHGAGD